MGFHVYALRRFIGEHFDVYFHLWRDGTPNWERENRLWELEQAKEWTEVLTKRAKRQSKSSKIVNFAKNPIFIPRSLYTSSCPDDSVKPQPSSVLRFGAFSFQIQGDSVHNESITLHKQVFDSSREQFVVHGSSAGSSIHSNLNSNCALIKDAISIGSDPNFLHAMHGVYFNCLESGHLAKSCRLPVQCKNCYNFSHLSRWCLTRTRAKLVRRPKSPAEPKSTVEPKSIAGQLSKAKTTKTANDYGQLHTPSPLFSGLPTKTTELATVQSNLLTSSSSLT